MTDHADLRRLAKDVIRIERSEDEPISAAWDLFDSAANPKTVLALLDEIDRLKAENDALRGAVEQLAEMLNSIHVPIDLNEILKGTTK
ncbi:TPA: hypothetical protein L6B67_02340 [Pseudomonas aeruginosa]|nr:hypothetical protein [Pseudomonas aeruginosa]